MKKQYETPKAEKLEFEYQDVVVASKNIKNGKTGHAINSCYTDNTNDMYLNFNICTGTPK